MVVFLTLCLCNILQNKKGVIIINRVEVIDQIIDLEWAMFSNVNNIDGKANCQEDPQGFKVMRASQAETWSDELLQSYYFDLQFAEASGRNLFTEKYGRMMEYTIPEEYEKIKDRFPQTDAETKNKIEKILEIYLIWDKEVQEKYPNVRAKGRKTYSSEDSREATSFETYFRGELQTYSPRTIDIYYEFVLEKLNLGENLGELQLANTAKYFGYQSLDELNKRIANY